MIAPSSVVLPAPLGPITVTIIPGATRERYVVHRLDLAVGHVSVADLEQRVIDLRRPRGRLRARRGSR